MEIWPTLNVIHVSGDPSVGGVHGAPPHHPPPHLQQHPQAQQSNGAPPNSNIDLGAVYQQTVENRVTK